MNTLYLPSILIPQQPEVPIYHIDITFDKREDKNVSQATLTLQVGGRKLGEQHVKLKYFSHISEAMACYIATGTSIFDYDKKLVKLDNIYAFAGEFLWSVIHISDGAKKLWREFTEKAAQSTMNGGIIVTTGIAAMITFPLECLSNYAENNFIAVVKQNNKNQSISEVLFSRFPEKLILVLERIS